MSDTNNPEEKKSLLELGWFGELDDDQVRDRIKELEAEKKAIDAKWKVDNKLKHDYKTMLQESADTYYTQERRLEMLTADNKVLQKNYLHLEELIKDSQHLSNFDDLTTENAELKDALERGGYTKKEGCAWKPPVNTKVRDLHLENADQQLKIEKVRGCLNRLAKLGIYHEAEDLADAIKQLEQTPIPVADLDREVNNVD